MNEQKVKKPLWKKWWFWVIIGVVLICIIVPPSDDDTSKSKETTPVATKAPETPEQTYAKENSISEEKAKSIIAVCEKIGIEPDSLNDDDTMYWEDYVLSFAFEGDNVTAVTSGQVVFYIADSETITRVPDLLFTTTEKSYAKTYAKEVINKVLKAPSTAEYPGGALTPFEDWNFTKDGQGNYTVSSYVDAQNSFGAMIRSTFSITYSIVDDNYIPSSVIFDGDELL